ncbi:MAG TPA: type 2 isopentenyl-diphosphate Delta-isomerase, partial [Chloroflexota bacterium]
MSVASSRQGTSTRGRKAEHIRINLEEDVAGKGITTGFEHYRFVPRALPEIDLAEVDLSQEQFGYRLGAPLFISCMTGGVPEAERINMTLAEAAQELGLAIGLGSARVLLEHPEVLPSFNIRSRAPDVPILANLGAVQLNRGVGIEQCRRLVDLLQA